MDKPANCIVVDDEPIAREILENHLERINKFFEESSTIVPMQSGEIRIEKDDFIFVRSDRKMVKVNFKDIVFIESLSDYIKIHLEEQKVLVTRDTLSNIEARLPLGDFIRIHRSFIVSMHRIETFTSDTIGIGKHELPISRSYRDVVNEKLSGC